MKSKLFILISIICLVSIFFGINWIYHAWHNPAIILHHFSSFSGDKWKSPKGTWNHYGDTFLSHETEIMQAEFLAAIAQQESAGNAIATTYWRWKWSSNPFAIYAPASSSIGLYQYTKGTFDDAKRFCVHWGEPALRGEWYDGSSCWFNSFYSRLIPSHAIEMTAGRLQYYINKVTEGKGVSRVDKRKLATIIHLCGKGKARQLIKAHFQIESIGLCGSHNPKTYHLKIERLRKQFKKWRN